MNSAHDFTPVPLISHDIISAFDFVSISVPRRPQSKSSPSNQSRTSSPRQVQVQLINDSFYVHSSQNGLESCIYASQRHCKANGNKHSIRGCCGGNYQVDDLSRDKSPRPLAIVLFANAVHNVAASIHCNLRITCSMPEELKASADFITSPFVCWYQVESRSVLTPRLRSVRTHSSRWHWYGVRVAWKLGHSNVFSLLARSHHVTDRSAFRVLSGFWTRHKFFPPFSGNFILVWSFYTSTVRWLHSFYRSRQCPASRLHQLKTRLNLLWSLQHRQ